MASHDGPSPSIEPGHGSHASVGEPLETGLNITTTWSSSKSKKGDQSGPKLRKRTKTGCLTCRKRRIKCGEERPTCNNCIKSRRHCEGYSQRVIFKPPIGDWPGLQGGSANTLPYHTSVLPGSRPGAPPPGVPLAPRPDFDFSAYEPGAGLPYVQEPSSQVDQAFAQANPAFVSPTYPENPPPSATFYSPQNAQFNVPFRSPVENQFTTSAQQYTQQPIAQSAYATSPAVSYPHGQSFIPQPQSAVEVGIQGQQSMLEIQQSANGGSMGSEYGAQVPQSHVGRRLSSQSVNVEERVPPSASSLQSRFSYQELEKSNVAISEPENKGHVQESPNVQYPPQTPSFPTSGAPFTEDPVEMQVSPTQMLDNAAVEYEDDDYYDVQSDDDEMDFMEVDSFGTRHKHQHDFTMMLQLHKQHTDEMSVRRYDTFIYEGILDHYRAEWHANPLKNPNTARVFAHFIYATGPSLSIYERHPRNTSAIFTGQPVPASQQSLWTYTLPMMALNNQGLLHAMLALASLHIAKLQGASVTPSYKHYAYALKRIHHAVGHRSKRHMVTTLAATLLLGFYEVMTADHMKWSSHLIGAKQLMTEIDYPSLTREWRRRKQEQDALDQMWAMQNPDMNYDQFASKEPGLDEGLISTLIGRKLKYDEFGRIIDDRRPSQESSPKNVDIAHFDLFQDLFWWYCRQDAYQSIVSGNHLLMDYSRWSDCPPRARSGDPSAVYGTHDHLLLLIGRIAAFSARDRERKIKVVEANGGMWRPPGPPPGANLRLQQQASPVSGQGPPPGVPQAIPMPKLPFYGMAPSAGVTHMPSSFAAHKPRSPSSSPTQAKDIDLQAATASALEEWTQIRAALQTFESTLGTDFQPLSAEYHQPLWSPFGDALQYRSYDIGVISGLMYMAQIIAIRSHPHMPPATHMAAGVAAGQTAELANKIGRIAAGIVPTPQNMPLNPSLGAALCEITMPLFFSGITYTDPNQRRWLVERIADIEARTGWASTGMIGHGCETAWERAGQAGRGPPWTRMRTRPGSDDPRANRREASLDEPSTDLTDRRYVHVNPGTRLTWAMGLLAQEEDVEARKHVAPLGIQIQ